jgi:hypothetical protein
MADVPDAREDTGTAPGGAETEAFDYAEPAELFTRRNPAAHIAAGTSPADADRARSRASHRKAIDYRRFASVAEAIRYAIEELAPDALSMTVLVVNGERHGPAAIRLLYESADYPLLARNIASVTPIY